eukprot:COSAG06_NODE_37631_length_433_cov_0.520958_1_plen_57_part_01
MGSSNSHALICRKGCALVEIPAASHMTWMQEEAAVTVAAATAAGVAMIAAVVTIGVD